jgi:glycosyltransferase involved in cell wall biosynthesis
MIKVAVILLAYRQQQYIRKALESLSAQDRPPSEVVVVDDCSPDETRNEIRSFISSQASTWKFVPKNTNEGVVAAARAGVAETTCEVIILAAGDDISLPSRVAETARFFHANPGICGLVFAASVIDAKGVLTGKTVNPPSKLPARIKMQELSGHDFLAGLHACGAASAFRREVFDYFLPVRDDVYADDRVYAFRAILLGGCDFLSEPMVRWRDHGENLSFLSGRLRGPHLENYFRRCAAVLEQHMQDLDFWKERQTSSEPYHLHRFQSELRAERDRLRFLSACHKPGIAIVSVLKAAIVWLTAPGEKIPRLAPLAKAMMQLVTPYPLQRALVRIRSRHA